jgi:hypothetical protein
MSFLLVSSSPALGGGGGGGGNTFIVSTDFLSGPITGGENNKGAYLSIYGTNMGTFSQYGLAGTRHVMINGVEVDNYRSLTNCKGDISTIWGVKRLAFQVGAVGSPTAGVECVIDIVDNSSVSVCSNPTSGGFLLDLDGDRLSFINQPGPIYFVAASGGNNGNVGSKASPFASLQNSSGTTGPLKIAASVNDTTGCKPGTCVYMLPGAHSSTGLNSRGVDYFRITGTSPTGATDRGYINIGDYPGDAGADNWSAATWSGPSGVGGFVNGNDSTRAEEVSTAFGGFTGWCKYMAWANIGATSSGTSGSDGGPFNLQHMMFKPRIINCEASWPNTIHGLSGGIEGSPNGGRIRLMYIHDVLSLQNGSEETHGVYLDSGVSAGAQNNIFSFLQVKNIPWGNAFQLYSTGSVMTGNVLHHFFFDGGHKHGVNIADNCRSFTFYNGVIKNSGQAAIRSNTAEVTVLKGIYGYNCTIYGWDTTNVGYTAFRDDSVTGSGTVSMDFENMVVVQTPSHANTGYDWIAQNTTKFKITKGLYYDPNGRLVAKPSEDSTGAYGNPLFTNVATDDYSVGNGSPAIDTGNTPTVGRATDFLIGTAPLGVGHDKGAYERAA